MKKMIIATLMLGSLAALHAGNYQQTIGKHAQAYDPGTGFSTGGFGFGPQSPIQFGVGVAKSETDVDMTSNVQDTVNVKGYTSNVNVSGTGAGKVYTPTAGQYYQ